MKFKLIIFLTLVFCNYYSQTYKNLNKYKGFKEIWIGEDISKYKSNTIKILKNDKKYYGGMPETDKDVYFYQSSTTKTIFGYKIASVYVVTNYNGKVSQISIILSKPDNEQQILNFFETEFGIPYKAKAMNQPDNQLYLWSGDEIALRVMYMPHNGNKYVAVDYLESYDKVQSDK